MRNEGQFNKCCGSIGQMQEETVHDKLMKATADALNFNKPEDVVKALRYAYEYMFNIADDQSETHAVLLKMYELGGIYDGNTGKRKDDKVRELKECSSEFEYLDNRLSCMERDVPNIRETVNQNLPRLKALEIAVNRLERMAALNDNT